MTKREEMTDEEVLAEMQSDSLLNRVCRIFSSEAARMEQAAMQRRPPTPIENRRMEFAAAQRLIDAILRENSE